MGTKVRLKNCNEKNNVQGEESGKIEEFFFNFIVFCFRSQKSDFFSIPLVCSGRTFLIFNDWMKRSFAEKREKRKGRSLARWEGAQSRTKVRRRRRGGSGQGKGEAYQVEWDRSSLWGVDDQEP